MWKLSISILWGFSWALSWIRVFFLQWTSADQPPSVPTHNTIAMLLALNSISWPRLSVTQLFLAPLGHWSWWSWCDCLVKAKTLVIGWVVFASIGLCKFYLLCGTAAALVWVLSIIFEARVWKGWSRVALLDVEPLGGGAFREFLRFLEMQSWWEL